MDTEEFRKLVDKALEELPAEFSEKLDNVGIFVQDLPTRAQMEKVRVRGMLLGLYEGIPQTKRSGYGIGGTMPDRISLFRFPILALSQTPEDVEKTIKDTVIHEIAHHFGMDEKSIRKAEAKRVYNKKV